MTTKDVLTHRLANQQLTKTRFTKPTDVVSWLGAVQSQDYSSAKWALGQRLASATDSSIEDAFTKGDILRTHVMRPTWHFVHPLDIRWILELTAPRVKAVMAYYNRQLGLNDTIFKKSNAILAKALQGGKQLTRTELGSILRENGVATKGIALGHVIMQAELEAVICSGPRRGKQFTYMLLEERAPQAKKLTREEARAELTKRYFTSHGPATIKDFVWWSGLTVADAKKGIEMLNSHLVSESIDGKTYFFSPSHPPEMTEEVYLLPNYDEYTIAYKERSAFYNPLVVGNLTTRDNIPFAHTIIIGGRIVGMWRRIVKKESIEIEAKFITKPTDEEYQAFMKATDRLGKFLSMSVILS